MATNWKTAQKRAVKNVLQAPVNATLVTMVNPGKYEDLCAAIEEAYPDLAPDFQAVEKAGASANGAIKLAVYKRNANKAEGLKAANVTIYGSGKVVWTNLAPITA